MGITSTNPHSLLQLDLFADSPKITCTLHDSLTQRVDGGEIAGDLTLQQEPTLVLGDFTQIDIQSVLRRYHKI